MTDTAAALNMAFHALADPTRRAVIARLGGGEMAVTTLAAPFGMALPSFVQHLRLLETAGLIISEKRGRSRYCRLQPAQFDEIAAWLARERATWAGRMDRLEQYLDQQIKDQTHEQPL